MLKKYLIHSIQTLFLHPLCLEIDLKSCCLCGVGNKWRVVRVVEGARLESVYTRKGIEGSNPSLSATKKMKPSRVKVSISFDLIAY